MLYALQHLFDRQPEDSSAVNQFFNTFVHLRQGSSSLANCLKLINIVTMQSPQTITLGFNQRDKCFFGKFKSPEGKWKTKFVPVAYKDEGAAKVWFADFLNGLAAGSVPTNKQVTKTVHTLSTIFPLWDDYIHKVRTNKAGNPLDAATIVCWRGKASKYVLGSTLAHVPLTAEQFTPHVALAWVEWIKSLGVAKYTVKHIVGVARIMVGDARKKGWIDLPFNPFADEIVMSEVPAGETVAGKDNPIHLSKEEACQLMACSAASIPLYRKVKNVLALCTGARSAELQGLAWKHVDLKSRLLVIDRQLKKGGSCPVFGPCKRGSERTLPLHSLAVEALRHWQKVTGGSGDDPLFPDPRTGLWCPANAARSFRDDLVSAGLSSQYQGKFAFDQHATRRTFLTLLDDAGVSSEAASAMVGHSRKGVRKHYVAAHVERFIREIQKLPFGKVKLTWAK